MIGSLPPKEGGPSPAGPRGATRLGGCGGWSGKGCCGNLAIQSILWRIVERAREGRDAEGQVAGREEEWLFLKPLEWR